MNKPDSLFIPDKRVGVGKYSIYLRPELRFSAAEKRRRAFPAHFWPVGPSFLDSEGNFPTEYGNILKFKIFKKFKKLQNQAEIY